MKVQLERTFALPATAEAAWTLLQDIEKVAGCMPGARITERIGERQYKGTVAVKLGPASMSFRGDVEVMSLDAATKTLRLVGKGTDSTGGSGASMDLTARVEAVDAASCKLVGNSEVSMSGKAAAFGGRMMNSVADQLMKQFAANFAAQVQALQPAAPAAGTAASSSDVPVSGAAAASASSTPTAVAQATSAPAAQAAASTGPAPDAPSHLNALALLWAVIKDWFRSLFSAKKA